MSVVLNYTYRIYPDAKQEAKLLEWLEICRSSYNYALREIKDWCNSRKCPVDRCSLESEYIILADVPFPGYYRQQNALPKAKKDYPRLAEVPSQVLQTNLRRLHDAWEFFQKRGFGFPRFKKYGQLKSLLFPQVTPDALTGWQIKIPKLGSVQINQHRPLPEGFVIKQVRIIRKAVRWEAVVSIESDIEIPTVQPHGRAVRSCRTEFMNVNSAAIKQIETTLLLKYCDNVASNSLVLWDSEEWKLPVQSVCRGRRKLRLGQRRNLIPAREAEKPGMSSREIGSPRYTRRVSVGRMSRHCRSLDIDDYLIHHTATMGAAEH
ncbi:MAG: hypothetical protein Fur006_29610 [Coleofasciculaceae cyanobacterium]